MISYIQLDQMRRVLDVRRYSVGRAMTYFGICRGRK